METFGRYERGSIRCEKMSFHATVSPSVTDKIPPEKIPEFIREYMEKMGYGKQPYIVYRHDDTGRIHYHIVSVRVDENGRKIPDFQERRRSQQALKELAEKYGYDVGKKAEAGKKEKTPNPYNGFKPEEGDYGRQIEHIADLAMTYHFKKSEHFDLIMKSLNVRVVHLKDGTVGFLGLDPKTGKPCTSLIKDEGIRFPSLDDISRRAAECKGKIRNREKERARNVTNFALSKCKTELHFRRTMAKSGIYVQLRRNVNGGVYSVSLVDHITKSVFRANELGFKAADFKELEAERGKPLDTAHEEKPLSSEIADIAIAAAGAERSRRSEDEEIMRRGRKGPSQ